MPLLRAYDDRVERDDVSVLVSRRLHWASELRPGRPGAGRGGSRSGGRLRRVPRRRDRRGAAGQRGRWRFAVAAAVLGIAAKPVCRRAFSVSSRAFSAPAGILGLKLGSGLGPDGALGAGGIFLRSGRLGGAGIGTQALVCSEAVAAVGDFDVGHGKKICMRRRTGPMQGPARACYSGRSSGGLCISWQG